MHELWASMERWKSGAKMFDREGKCMTITSAQEYLIKKLYEELGMDYDEDEIASILWGGERG